MPLCYYISLALETKLSKHQADVRSSVRRLWMAHATI